VHSEKVYFTASACSEGRSGQRLWILSLTSGELLSKYNGQLITCNYDIQGQDPILLDNGDTILLAAPGGTLVGLDCSCLSPDTALSTVFELKPEFHHSYDKWNWKSITVDGNWAMWVAGTEFFVADLVERKILLHFNEVQVLHKISQLGEGERGHNFQSSWIGSGLDVMGVAFAFFLPMMS